MTAGSAARSLDSGPPAALEVAALDVHLPTEDGDVHAVRGVGFALAPGEVLAIVGESGGKGMELLEGRVAIVTGGGRGIGREHCRELAARGASVVVNDLGVGLRGEASDELPAEAVAEEIRAMGGRAVADSTSVADWEGTARLIKRTVAEMGRLDILVNNAGIVREGRIHATSVEDWDAVMDVHVKGSFILTRHVCEYWRESFKSGARVSGRIINTTSRAGIFGMGGLAAYGTAKAAVVGMTLNVAIDMERYGVTANAICPVAATRMLSSSRAMAGRVVPAGDWDPLHPGNSSPVVAWLASEESGWLTGQVLQVFGNTVIRVHPWAGGETYQGNRQSRLRAEEVGRIVRQLFGARPTEITPGS
jgi:NAD(P)-dependent dehydrogenase (short-subunit alcohol dehydrogenase family)